MTDDSTTNSDKKNSKKILFINLAIVLIMGLTCVLNNDGSAFAGFFIGIAAAVFNFIFMIIYITQRKTMSYITCLICMLLLPVIGFGCCAIGFTGLNLH